MINWITTLKGAVLLATLHLFTELWRSFLDFTFVLPEFSGGAPGQTALYALIYTLVYAGWLFSLSNARQGRRGGLVGALVFSLLFLLGVDISTFFFYCPGGCEVVLFDITTWISTIIGALSLYGLLVNLRGRGSQPAAS